MLPASPLATTTSRFSPSSSRTGESFLRMIVVGENSASSASIRTGVSASMPAVFTCSTKASPNRSTITPGMPSASAWISR